MAKPKINSCYNYQDDMVAEITDKNVGKSKTVPNEVDTVQTILKRAAAGNLPPEGDPSYFDADIDAINRYHRKYLDLTDLQELQKETQELQANVVRQKQLLEERLLEKKVEERLKQQEDDAAGSSGASDEGASDAK